MCVSKAKLKIYWVQTEVLGMLIDDYLMFFQMFPPTLPSNDLKKASVFTAAFSQVIGLQFFWRLTSVVHAVCIYIIYIYCITVLLYYCITVLYYCITVLLYYCITVLLYYCITVLLYYCIIVLQYYCIAVLLYYCITVL